MGETKQEREQLKTLVAVLVAISAVFGAIITWRSLVATGGAGGSDSRGINATINREENRSLTSATLSQHQEGYINYLANREIAAQIKPQAAEKDFVQQGVYGEITDTVALAQVKDLRDELERRAEDAASGAGVAQYFFVTDYLEQDGSYNTARELGEANAEADRYRDVNPTPYFARADTQRQKGLGMVGVLVVFAFAGWTFVLAQVLPRQWRAITLLVGIIILFMGAAIGISLEFAV